MNQEADVFIAKASESQSGAETRAYLCRGHSSERRWCRMSAERREERNRRMADAVRELQGLISARYPEAAYEVVQGEDPPGARLLVMANVPEDEDVLDVVVDRLLEMQVEEGLPLYVIPLSSPRGTSERLQADRQLRWAGHALLDEETPVTQTTGG
jgi:hypothetical protein